MTQNNWTYEETLVAFNVFCKIPFKDSNKNHPLVIEYAQLIGRTPSAMNMKIGNIGRLDPSLRERGIVGLAHGSKMEQRIWNEFEQDPERFVLKVEDLILRLHDDTAKSIFFPNGSTKTEELAFAKQRVGQTFFRTAVLNSYHNSCCISGTKEPLLLEACHIVDWSLDTKNRTNPSNGLCLNVYFHKTFDNYLIGISPDYKIEISEQLLETSGNTEFRSFLLHLDGRKICMPDQFLPNKDLLAIHYDKYITCR